MPDSLQTHGLYPTRLLYPIHSTVNSRPHPGIALQYLCSSSKPLCFLRDLHLHPVYVGLWQRLFVWDSFHSDCHRSATSLSASNASLFQTMPQCGDLIPASVPLTHSSPLPGAGPPAHCHLFPTSFLHPTKFCLGLWILFWQPGTRAHSQMVFCNIFSVWKCIPDVSMERDVFQVHLLLHHLILPISPPPNTTTPWGYSFNIWICWGT